MSWRIAAIAVPLIISILAPAIAGTHTEFRALLRAYVELTTTGLTVFAFNDGCSHNYPELTTEYSRATGAYQSRNSLDMDEARDQIFQIARQIDGDQGVYDMRVLLKGAFDKIISRMKGDSNLYTKRMCQNMLFRIRQGLFDTTTEANSQRLEIIMGF